MTGFHDMLGHRSETDGGNGLGQALALDELAKTLAVLAFFHPPFPDAFDDFLDLVVRLFDLDEGNQQGAHLRAVEDRGLGADQDGQTAVIADALL